MNMIRYFSFSTTVHRYAYSGVRNKFLEAATDSREIQD